MRKVFYRLIRRTVVALAVALCLVSAVPGSASAQSLGEYFDYNSSVQLSKSQVTGIESFSATITANATCKKPFLVPATKATIAGRIVAENQASGARVTLNSDYTLTIDPFPSATGETTSVNIAVPLQFPSGSVSGTYGVIAELIEAKVYVGLVSYSVPTAILSSAETVGTVTYTAASGGVVGGGVGGGIPASTRVSINGLTANNYLSVNSQGIVQDSIRLQVTAADAFLDIAEGIKMLTAGGNALDSITASEGGELPTPAPGKAIVHAVDFGPDGATFTPAITLAMDFDGGSLMEGMAAEELYIAYWDGSEWQAIPGTLDVRMNRLSAKVSHFTRFAIMGGVPGDEIPLEEPSAPTTQLQMAVFNIRDLSITPKEMTIYQTGTVSAIIANTGNSGGSYMVTFKLNGVEEYEKELVMAAGVEYEVSFKLSPGSPGNYDVDVNGLTGSFTVVEPAPEIITTTPEPAEVTEPAEETPDEPSRPWFLNWWYIGGAAAVLVLLIWLVVFLVGRMRY
ncbi:hypothetical protein ACFLVC_02945 [Chloroflexota bacterium]